MPTSTFKNLPSTKRKRIYKAIVEEFSQRSFDEVNLSNIVRNSAISRGSLYQYFDDKKDIFFYLLEEAGKKKMTYMADLLDNKENLPFLDLYKQLYIQGINFTINNPKLSKVFSMLIMKNNSLYQEITQKNMSVAIDIYGSLIDKDKKNGRIKSAVDTHVLAKFLYNFTIQQVNTNFYDEHGNIKKEEIFKEFDMFLDVIRYGISR